MTQTKILMVDDSPTVISIEKMMLREEGFELVTAGNGRLAIDAVKSSPPDLILMDVVMPEMDGIECCKTLKSDPAYKNIPIIMVTTKGNQTMVTSAYSAGCDDFVTKPIDKVELLHKVRGLLARRDNKVAGAST